MKYSYCTRRLLAWQLLSGESRKLQCRACGAVRFAFGAGLLLRNDSLLNSIGATVRQTSLFYFDQRGSAVGLNRCGLAQFQPRNLQRERVLARGLGRHGYGQAGFVLFPIQFPIVAEQGDPADFLPLKLR